MSETPAPRRFSLSEDWLATLIGLLLVAVIGFGLLGPGAQSHKLTAAAGESANAYALPIGGWKAAFTVDGEKVTVADAPTSLEPESADAPARVVAFTCADGQLALDPDLAATISARPEGGKATLLLVNDCDVPVTVTYTTDPIVRWPLFNLFAR
ncbi:MAG: hypothetical protein JNL34_03075 [Anaerolineae bacterium]|nr:hypothetical protein [Anaerolineae bacterium]